MIQNDTLYHSCITGSISHTSPRPAPPERRPDSTVHAGTLVSCVACADFTSRLRLDLCLGLEGCAGAPLARAVLLPGTPIGAHHDRHIAQLACPAHRRRLARRGGGPACRHGGTPPTSHRARAHQKTTGTHCGRPKQPQGWPHTLVSALPRGKRNSSLPQGEALPTVVRWPTRSRRHRRSVQTHTHSSADTPVCVCVCCLRSSTPTLPVRLALQPASDRQVAARACKGVRKG